MEFTAVKRLDQDLIDRIAEQARSNVRLRQNYNFHDHSEKVQRFINVLQPGTYVRPHRHCRAADINGFEFFLVLQGTLGLAVLNDRGEIGHWEQASAQGPTRGIELPEGTYHTLVALEPNTVILELKEGPYNPSGDKEFLVQFPLEGTAEAQAIVSMWEQSCRSVTFASLPLP